MNVKGLTWPVPSLTAVRSMTSLAAQRGHDRGPDGFLLLESGEVQYWTTIDDMLSTDIEN